MKPHWRSLTPYFQPIETYANAVTIVDNVDEVQATLFLARSQHQIIRTWNKNNLKMSLFEAAVSNKNLGENTENTLIDFSFLTNCRTEWDSEWATGFDAIVLF